MWRDKFFDFVLHSTPKDDRLIIPSIDRSKLNKMFGAITRFIAVGINGPFSRFSIHPASLQQAIMEYRKNGVLRRHIGLVIEE